MKLRKHYQVNEIFTSVQGEGVLTGVRATFIRLQGCTVGCPWCDTKYTWAKGGERMAVKDILSQVETLHVIITGGEPTMYDLDGLIVPLHTAKHVVQLETSGQNGIKGAVKPDWITWSPKANLDYDAPFDIKSGAKEVKWVVDEHLTFDRVMQQFDWYVARIKASPNSNRPMPTRLPYFSLMPEGCPPRQPLVERTLDWMERVPMWAQQLWRYSDRIQYRIGVE